MRLIFFYFSLFLFVWGYEVDAASLFLKGSTKALDRHSEKKDQKENLPKKEVRSPPPVDYSKAVIKVPISILQKIHEKMLKIVCDDLHNLEKKTPKKTTILLGVLAGALASNIIDIDKAKKAEAPVGKKDSRSGSSSQPPKSSRGKKSSATIDLNLAQQINVDLANAIKSYSDDIVNQYKKKSSKSIISRLKSFTKNMFRIGGSFKSSNSKDYKGAMRNHVKCLLAADKKNIPVTPATSGLHINILKAVLNNMNDIVSPQSKGKSRSKHSKKDLDTTITDLAGDIKNTIDDVQKASTAVHTSPAPQKNPSQKKSWFGGSSGQKSGGYGPGGY